MATGSKNQSSKKMEYKKVQFDVNEISPDAPEGEWDCSIPRGKCKVQPTKDDKFPMVIVPVRLDGTEEEGEKHQKALGTELSVFCVFGGKTQRGENMNKLRIRNLCEAADVDLDVIPKEINDPENDLEPFIKALEGKKFKIWTVLQLRKDTGEETTDVRFKDPTRKLGNPDADDDDEPEERPRGGARKKAPSNGKSRR